MNIVGCLGCLLVGLDLLGKALGTVPQTLFSHGNEWVWYGAAAIWFAWSAAFAIKTVTH